MGTRQSAPSLAVIKRGWPLLIELWGKGHPILTRTSTTIAKNKSNKYMLE
jgi:hypothetical protein